MNECKFQPGDRVTCISPVDGNNDPVGKNGTIIGESLYVGYYAVEFDSIIKKGHDCDGLVEFGRGYFVRGDCMTEELKPLSNAMPYEELML